MHSVHQTTWHAGMSTDLYRLRIRTLNRHAPQEYLTAAVRMSPGETVDTGRLPQSPKPRQLPHVAANHTDELRDTNTDTMSLDQHVVAQFDPADPTGCHTRRVNIVGTTGIPRVMASADNRTLMHGGEHEKLRRGENGSRLATQPGTEPQRTLLESRTEAPCKINIGHDSNNSTIGFNVSSELRCDQEGAPHNESRYPHAAENNIVTYGQDSVSSRELKYAMGHYTTGFCQHATQLSPATAKRSEKTDMLP
jgi:hypothetical protein